MAEGLYVVSAHPALARGDFVIARLPPGARRIAAARAYLPANVPLVKRVAAVAGDQVCADGAWLDVDGSHLARRLPRDAKGRVLSWWDGCRALGEGEVLLLGSAMLSYDGRYFGPTSSVDVIGKAKLLWRS